MREPLKQGVLVHNRIHGLFDDDFGFEHLLHRIDDCGLLVFDFPDFAEAPLPDHELQLEIVFADGLASGSLGPLVVI